MAIGIPVHMNLFCVQLALCVRSCCCHVCIVCLVSLEYVLSLATGWTCVLIQQSSYPYGRETVRGLEFNRFCFGRLGRRNPVIPRVRELAELSSSLNTLVFSSSWNCCFVFLVPHCFYLLHYSFFLSLICSLCL